MMTTAHDDAAFLDEIAQRSAGTAVGDRVHLDDLRARDPCGPAMFDSLAQRFGWRRDEAGWVRERVPRWTPGWVRKEHEEQWMDLFNAAFEYRMAQPLWRWKYRRNALPGMGAWRDGKLVAFYGGMTREVMHCGVRENTMQIGDVMTRPEERGVMTRSGPFQVAASTYMERNGAHPLPPLLGYGFPTDKALKIAQRLGLYEQVDQVVELSWTAQRNLASNFETGELLTPSRAAAVDALWESMAAGLKDSVVGVRDWAYIADRYMAHPVNRYDLLLVKNRLGIPKGLVVMRDRRDNGVEILDLVGPPSRWRGLIRAVRRWTTNLDRPHAYLWTTRSHAALLEPTAPTVRELDLMVPASVWIKGPTAPRLRGNWWLTGGDTDFR